jgi:hypothetical protein
MTTSGPSEAKSKMSADAIKEVTIRKRQPGAQTWLVSCRIPDVVYIPRNPEGSILYRLVAAQLDIFLERQHRRGHRVPWFVERELRSFLQCAALANG